MSYYQSEKKEKSSYFNEKHQSQGYDNEKERIQGYSNEEQREGYDNEVTSGGYQIDDEIKIEKEESHVMETKRILKGSDEETEYILESWISEEIANKIEKNEWNFIKERRRKRRRKWK
jgi:hypothetical protein